MIGRQSTLNHNMLQLLGYDIPGLENGSSKAKSLNYASRAIHLPCGYTAFVSNLLDLDVSYQGIDFCCLL